jgi:hypothetical protein
MSPLIRLLLALMSAQWPEKLVRVWNLAEFFEKEWILLAEM